MNYEDIKNAMMHFLGYDEFAVSNLIKEVEASPLASFIFTNAKLSQKPSDIKDMSFKLGILWALAVSKMSCSSDLRNLFNEYKKSPHFVETQKIRDGYAAADKNVD